MNREIWKDIYFVKNNIVYDYRGLYQVSNLGRVKSLHKNNERILKPRYNEKGYVKYALYKNNIRKDFTGHYLVITAFVKNNENKAMINHKNGVKDDNNIFNLEYCTNSENIIHALENKLFKKHKRRYRYNKQNGRECLDKYRDLAIAKASQVNSKPIIQYDLNGNKLKEWDSVRNAERYYNKRIHVERVNSIGFIWKYKEELL